MKTTKMLEITVIIIVAFRENSWSEVKNGKQCLKVLNH